MRHMHLMHLSHKYYNVTDQRMNRARDLVSSNFTGSSSSYNIPKHLSIEPMEAADLDKIKKELEAKLQSQIEAKLQAQYKAQYKKHYEDKFKAELKAQAKEIARLKAAGEADDKFEPETLGMIKQIIENKKLQFYLHCRTEISL